MKNASSNKQNTAKYQDIIKAATKLFSEIGYEKTAVRQIVKEANTSMGNLYFHFPNKLSILKVICKELVGLLRKQISEVKALSFSPEVGFSLDFKIGYITTMEDPKFSKLFLMARNFPEIHKYSLENKRIRLRTFFGDQIQSGEDLNMLAIAIQGIADAFFEQKKEGNLNDSSARLSNTIIEYSLRLLGFSQPQIDDTIKKVESYIEKKDIKPYKFFNIQNLS